MKKPVSKLLINILLLTIPILLFSNASFSQVEIKEEIILTPQNESSSVLIMPFYGVVGEVIYAGRPACDGSKVSLIVNGETTLFEHCKDWDCAPPPLFCTCGGANVFKNVFNVFQGDLVETKIVKCMLVGEEYVWVELVNRFRIVPTFNADITYEIDVKIEGDWHNVGKINFTETTPPDCPNAGGNYCTSTLQTYPNVFIQQVEYSTQYRQKDDCINDNQWAYTVPASKNYIVDFNISDVCFNLQTQRWQFEVNNNNILHVRNILQICDKPQILDDFSQLPPGYSCEELMKDLDAMEKREIHNYLFRDLLWWHEYQHIKESENSLSKFRNDFVERLEELVFDFECSDFPDPLEASLIAKERYEKTLKEYYIKSMLDVPIYTDKITEDERKKLELQLNSNILGVIDAYRYNAKMNYCN